MYRVKKTKPSSRKSFDVLFWLLADQLAGIESQAGAVGARAPPNSQDQQLLLGALCQLMGFSESHMLSQLLLQLLLLSHSMPPLEAMRAGAPEAVHLVSSVVHACTEASLAAPGELLFAEAQTSLVLASVVLYCMHACMHASVSVPSPVQGRVCDTLAIARVGAPSFCIDSQQLKVLKAPS